MKQVKAADTTSATKAPRLARIPLVLVLALASLWLLPMPAAFAHAHGDGAAETVVVVPDPSPAVLQQLGTRFGHVLFDHKTREARVEADSGDRAWLSGLQLDWRIDEEATTALQASLQPLDALRAIPGYACYRTVEETTATIDTLVATHPLLASSIDIGDSWRRSQNPAAGYDLRVLKLTNSAIGGDKPKMFVMSSVHAREYTPAELMTRYAEELLAGYGSDADATWLLDHMEFHFLLQANPDGRKKAETGLSWRKNENITHCGGGNSAGIDLNRNYPVFWAYPNTGSSTNACSETFRGPSAASEPETQAVTDYVRGIFPDTRPGGSEDVSTPADADTRGLFLDIHSYSRLVLWPWGHDTMPSGNADALATLGMRLAWFNNYEPQQAVGLYATRGTTDDFAYGELGVPAYTIELGVAFFETCATFESTTAPLNLAALRYAARTLQSPYRLPAGPDAVSLAISPPLAVPGSPVTLDALIDDGRYRDQQSATDAPSLPRARHAIAAANYYVDQLPWQTGATGHAMTAINGSFDGVSETVTASIDTSQLVPGRHLVYVQGTDVAGELGPPSAVFLTLRNAAELARITGRITSAANGSGIDAAHIDAGSNHIRSSQGDYALYVEPGTIDLDVSATGFWPTSVAAPSIAAGQAQTLDIALQPACAGFADDAENGNAAGWTVQSPWATATVSGASGMAWTDSPSGNYGHNLDISLTSPVLPVAGGSAWLEFDHRCRTESGYDYGYVEIQVDGGNWTQVYACDGANDWRHESIDLTSTTGSQDLRIRFRLKTDQSISAEGWSIDNIRLFASALTCSGSAVEVFADGFEQPVLR